METIKKLAGLAALVILSFTSHAAGFRAASLLQGQGTLIVYNGTGDTAVTWKTDDSYATNRSYVANSGSTTIPFSTNTVTGEIRPSFGIAIPFVPLRDAAANTNVTIQATVSFNANVASTNIITLSFARSCNGGVNYDITQLFDFGLAPGGTTAITLSTNLPLWFINGASHIQLYKVGLGSNATDAGIVTISKASLGSFTP